MSTPYAITGAAGQRWQAAPRPAGAAARRAAVAILLLGVTFGQRFCFPYGTFQIPLAVPIAYLALGLLLVSGRLRISTGGLVLYALAIAAMISTLYVGKDSFSPF